MGNYSQELIEIFREALNEGREKLQKRKEFKDMLENNVNKLCWDILKSLAEDFRKNPGNSTTMYKKKIYLKPLNKSSEMAKYIKAEGWDIDLYKLYSTEKETLLINIVIVKNQLIENGFRSGLISIHAVDEFRNYLLDVSISGADIIALMNKAIEEAEEEKEPEEDRKNRI